MSYKTDKEIEKEFIKNFIGNEDPADFGFDIINFILAIRHQDREAIREWIKNQKSPVQFMQDGVSFDFSFRGGFNKSLTDLLSFLDGLEGE